MGKGNNKKAKRISIQSSGLKRHRRARREITFTKIKIKRWENNQKNEKKEHKLEESHRCRSWCRSRHNNWNTDGLKRHLANMEKFLLTA